MVECVLFGGPHDGLILRVDHACEELELPDRAVYRRLVQVPDVQPYRYQIERTGDLPAP